MVISLIIVLCILPIIGILGLVGIDSKLAPSIGVVLWFILLMLLVTPVRRWKKDQKTIDCLEDQRRPKLDIVFRSGEPFEEITQIEPSMQMYDGRAGIRKSYRIQVENICDATVREVCVTLDISPSYTNPPAAYNYISLAPSFDLHPHTTSQIIQVINGFRANLNGVLDNVQYFELVSWHTPITPQSYELTLTVSGLDTQPCTRKFSVFLKDGDLYMEQRA